MLQKSVCENFFFNHTACLQAAFEKLYVLLEDSGWELQPEEEEAEKAEDE